MRICYFFSADWPEALRLLDEHAPQAERIYTGADKYAYWNAYRTRWDIHEDDFVTIEHDIGIHADVIPQFEDCTEPWCAFGYQIGSYICYTGNGCSKYSARLRLDVPMRDLMPFVPDVGQCPDCAAYCWAHFDTAVSARLHRAGFRPHVHEPNVRHLRMET